MKFFILMYFSFFIPLSAQCLTTNSYGGHSEVNSSFRIMKVTAILKHSSGKRKEGHIAVTAPGNAKSYFKVLSFHKPSAVQVPLCKV